MILESYLDRGGDVADCSSMRTLLVFSVATSIGALAIGGSLALLGAEIIWPAALIAVITFFVSVVGVYLGDRVAGFFRGRVEVFGGLILLLIAVKTLLEAF